MNWLTELQVYLSLLFVVLALMTIPYGAPMPYWYVWVLAVVGSLMITSLAADPSRRWRDLTLWPIFVVLGVWGVSIAACAFPGDVMLRSWSMALYSVVFIAAQVVTWKNRTTRLLVLAVLATIVVVAADLWWQRVTTRSLIREVRAPIVRAGDQWVFSETSGSQGNRNDHAVVAVLAPLLSAVLASRWAWGLLALGGLAALYDAAVVKSRQLILGVCVGLAAVCGLHAPARLRWWLVGVVVAAVALSVALHPNSRSRFMNMLNDPLTGRGVPMMYGLDLYQAQPLFGVGPSLYGHYYVKGVREGWTFRGTPLAPTGMPWVHSLPIEIACELGTVGLLGYAAVLLAFARRLRRALAIRGTTRDFAIAVTSASLTMALMGIIDLAFIKDWVRICWWLILGLGFAAPRLAWQSESTEVVRAPIAASA